MILLIANSNTNFDKIFKQFKREVEREGIIKEIKKREFYEKPSEIRKRKKMRKYRPHTESK
ncbi:MAG: 30S ribosomal protein S21 [Candidatus Omnitrophica bacterium]|nr:30S ribosomal protein S21 [Candidatus Omnitrophota bacterium]MCM8806699.1 30S ribosomal protein S21 [Candidatus Omnitrophota bacterium]